MYFFKESESVIYTGDMRTLDETRRNPSLAIVDKIELSMHPYVGLKLIPSNQLIGVEAMFIRQIFTEPEYLEKLGFKEVEERRVKFFEKDGIVIAGMGMVPRPGFYYNAGFRLLPHRVYEYSAQKYIIDGEVDDAAFDADYPNVTFLHDLIEYLKKEGHTVPKIEEIVDVHSRY